MSHLGEWKADQMKQRAAGDADWERQSVDPVTWHNLRRGVVAFPHLTAHACWDTRTQVRPCACDNIFLFGEKIQWSRSTKVSRATLSNIRNKIYSGDDSRACWRELSCWRSRDYVDMGTKSVFKVYVGMFKVKHRFLQWSMGFCWLWTLQPNLVELFKQVIRFEQQSI